MRCSRALKLAFRYEDGEVPADVALHLSGCSACRTRFEQLQTVRKLVSLKKHERPDAGFEQRSLLAIHRRLAELNQATGEDLAWDGSVGSSFPALRYIVIGTFAILVALQVISLPSAQPLRIPVAEVPVAVPTQAPAAVRASAPAPESPALATIQVASNRGPGRVEYGPSYLQTMPVNFEY
jgi:hypothetical protein